MSCSFTFTVRGVEISQIQIRGSEHYQGTRKGGNESCSAVRVSKSRLHCFFLTVFSNYCDSTGPPAPHISHPVITLSLLPNWSLFCGLKCVLWSVCCLVLMHADKWPLIFCRGQRFKWVELTLFCWTGFTDIRKERCILYPCYLLLFLRQCITGFSLLKKFKNYQGKKLSKYL